MFHSLFTFILICLLHLLNFKYGKFIDYNSIYFFINRTCFWLCSWFAWSWRRYYNCPSNLFYIITTRICLRSSNAFSCSLVLGVICFTSISSIRSHLKLKNTNLNIVKKWAFGIVLGSILGALSASFISGENLVIIFVILAFLISMNMLFQQKPLILNTDLPSSKMINFSISSLIGFFPQ